MTARKRRIGTALQKVQAGIVAGEIAETQRLMREVLPKWKLLPPSLALRQVIAVQNLLRKYAQEGEQ